MSVRDFAAHLGVSDRMVSKWEAGGAAICPRPVNQEALDTSLARASAEVKARFARAILSAQPADGGAGPAGAGATFPAAATHLVVHPEDGKIMTLVGAGPFRSGEDGTPRWLPGYYIDVFPVTNAEYAAFIKATDNPAPGHWVHGACPEALANHPVTEVSWFDACAYAAWAGKTLPSGQEWEKAARGRAGQRYPWGDAPAPDRCNIWESGLGTTTPVDRFRDGVSPYGAYDMCGNVWEWCATRTGKGRRQIKGGAFTSPADRAAPAGRTDARADARRKDVGFRCVLSIASMLELLSI